VAQILPLRGRHRRHSPPKLPARLARKVLQHFLCSRALALRAANLIKVRAILQQRVGRAIAADGCLNDADIHGADRKFIDRPNGLLEAHYEDPEFSCSTLADNIALSQRQFQRKLKALTNRTPLDFLRDFRLCTAAQQLSDDAPAGNAAYSTGFSSPSCFSRCFRARYGQTPSEYQQGIHSRPAEVEA